MAKTDLSNYNLAELKGLQFDIEKEIKSRQQDEVKKAREQILAIAQDMGVPVSALLSGDGGGKKGGAKKGANGQAGQARFRNPADESQTWTGRGRQPKWIAEGLTKGKSLDDFRI